MLNDGLNWKTKRRINTWDTWTQSDVNDWNVSVLHVESSSVRLWERLCYVYMGPQNTHEATTVFLSFLLSFLFSLLPSSPPPSQPDAPVILSPQLLMFLLVYVIIYKLTYWNMNTWEDNKHTTFTQKSGFKATNSHSQICSSLKVFGLSLKYFCRLYLSPKCKRGRRLHSEIDDNETKQNIKSQQI